LFLAPNFILNGNGKMILYFVANLFRKFPNKLGVLEHAETQTLTVMLDFVGGDTREERVFCNWMSSLGVPIRNMFHELKDGIILLKVLDKVNPGIVKWDKVNLGNLNDFKKLENCNYVIYISKSLNFSLVGISGEDIFKGNRKLILALVWQIMRYHMISVLKKIGRKDVSEDYIVNWANNLIQKSGRKSTILNFRDQSIKTGKFLIDLLYALKPRRIDWSLVGAGDTPDTQELNAKYAISIARQAGCCIFLLVGRYCRSKTENGVYVCGYSDGHEI